MVFDFVTARNSVSRYKNKLLTQTMVIIITWQFLDMSKLRIELWKKAARQVACSANRVTVTY